MAEVLVPVRYPLTEHSEATLAEAIGIAEREGSTLTVFHVNLYQDRDRTTRTDLKLGVEREFGPLENARYVVRSGFLVEETILDEVAASEADIVVIGRKQVGRWRRMLGRVLDDPDIERVLREHLDCRLVTVPADRYESS